MERKQAIREVKHLLAENGIDLTYNIHGFILTGQDGYKEENLPFSVVLKTLYLYLPLYQIRFRAFENDPYGFWSPHDPETKKLVADIQNFVTSMESFLKGE